MIRTRICLYILLLTPLAVYWQAIFQDYGMRDDYAHLREAREEPGKLVKFTASHGRPLYGALLETTFGVVDDVNQLPWLRLTTVSLLTLLGLALWRQLYQSGWTEIEAAAIGLGVVLLPAAQITASWAIGWPYALTLLLAVAGFSAIETELERGGLKRVVALLGGCMIYALAALVYQSNALFAIVPITAVLLVRTGREPMSDVKWLSYHLGALIVGLAVAYFLVHGLFSNGIFQESARMQLEDNPFGKLVWFFAHPLPNALALFVLRDDFNTGAVYFWPAALLVAGTIVAAFRLAAKPGETFWKRKWVWCLLLMPVLAHGVSLVAAERSVGYRVLFALSGLVLVLLVYALRVLTTARGIKPLPHYLALGVLAAGAAMLANQQALALLAEPHSHEWDLVRNAVQRANFAKPVKVFFVTPTIEHRSTRRVYADEFGSLSSDSDWVPREMFKAALHERFGGKLPKGGSYTFAAGRELPADQTFDLVIDLRKLKQRMAP
jgi:hypothetical protein